MPVAGFGSAAESFDLGRRRKKSLGELQHSGVSCRTVRHTTRSAEKYLRRGNARQSGAGIKNESARIKSTCDTRGRIAKGAFDRAFRAARCDHPGNCRIVRVFGRMAYAARAYPG